MEGPTISGHWYNQKTGDSFTVKDTFFEDNQFVVLATDGRMFKYSQLQHYIQTATPINSENKQKTEQLPAEVVDILENDSSADSYASTDYLLPEDVELLHGSKSLGNLAQTQSTGFSQVTKDTPTVTINSPALSIEDFTIIEKALGKKQLPEIEVGVDWENFPKKEIDMLYDVMEIPTEQIIKWYFSKVDVAYVTERLKRSIEDYIFRQIDPVDPELVTLPVVEYAVEKIEDPKPTPSQKKPATKRSTTKTTPKSKSKK
jgi:hypothetical protein